MIRRKEEWQSFLYSLSLSFTTSLYCSASKNPIEFIQRSQEAQEACDDIHMEVETEQDTKEKGADA